MYRIARGRKKREHKKKRTKKMSAIKKKREKKDINEFCWACSLEHCFVISKILNC